MILNPNKYPWPPSLFYLRQGYLRPTAIVHYSLLPALKLKGQCGELYTVSRSNQIHQSFIQSSDGSFIRPFIRSLIHSFIHVEAFILKLMDKLIFHLPMTTLHSGIVKLSNRFFRSSPKQIYKGVNEKKIVLGDRILCFYPDPDPPRFISFHPYHDMEPSSSNVFLKQNLFRII